MSRRHLRTRFVSLAALAGMLFLQAAIAFSPCELPGRSAATAIAAAMAAMPDCQEADTSALALAHCAGEEPVVVAAELQPPETAAPPAEHRVLVPATAPRVVVIPSYLAAAGPPPRILFQSFRL